MLGILDIGFVGYWRCGMLKIWNVGDAGCLGCGMFWMWDVGDVRCWGCGMFGIWDVWDVDGSGCGMWDVNLQNAVWTKHTGYFCQKLCLVPTKKSRKTTWNFTMSFHCKRTIATELNLQKQHKTRKNVVFSAACCPFFSGISAVVLILLLGACESEEFPTAEYNKSQNKL